MKILPATQNSNFSKDSEDAVTLSSYSLPKCQVEGDVLSEASKDNLECYIKPDINPKKIVSQKDHHNNYEHQLLQNENFTAEPVDLITEVDFLEGSNLETITIPIQNHVDAISGQTLPDKYYIVEDVISKGRPKKTKVSDLFYNPKNIPKGILDQFLEPLHVVLVTNTDSEKQIGNYVIELFLDLLTKNVNSEFRTCIFISPTLSLNDDNTELSDTNADIILMPVHKPGHWYLIIIESEVAKNYDSISHDTFNAQVILKKIWPNRSYDAQPQICAKQTNCWSYGIYVMLFSYRYCMKRPIDCIETNVMLNFRQYVL